MNSRIDTTGNHYNLGFIGKCFESLIHASPGEISTSFSVIKALSRPKKII